MKLYEALNAAGVKAFFINTAAVLRFWPGTDFIGNFFPVFMGDGIVPGQPAYFSKHMVFQADNPFVICDHTRTPPIFYNRMSEYDRITNIL